MSRDCFGVFFAKEKRMLLELFSCVVLGKERERVSQNYSTVCVISAKEKEGATGVYSMFFW